MSLSGDVTVSEAVAERAHRFLDQHRVLVRDGFTVPGTEYAYVLGDNAVHVVRADNDGVYCDCMAARRGHVCAHVAAAMATWAERESGNPAVLPTGAERDAHAAGRAPEPFKVPA
jgi:hypothetical protein